MERDGAVVAPSLTREFVSIQTMTSMTSSPKARALKLSMLPEVGVDVSALAGPNGLAEPRARARSATRTPTREHCRSRVTRRRRRHGRGRRRRARLHVAGLRWVLGRGASGPLSAGGQWKRWMASSRNSPAESGPAAGLRVMATTARLGLRGTGRRRTVASADLTPRRGLGLVGHGRLLRVSDTLAARSLTWSCSLVTHACPVFVV